jgi:hypothetical protein
MQTLIEQRLKELRAEFESGQRMMDELEIKKVNLRDTLLRISGAIQVLEELIRSESSAGEMPVKSVQNPENLESQNIEAEIEALE